MSVFSFDKRTATADQQWLAKNALQKLKTLRHPNIVKYIDSVDLPTHLHILTELVTPLVFAPIGQGDSVGQLGASLGLHQIGTTLSWLNNDAQLVHSNLHPGSLYTTDSGDWKLFGFDLCHKGTEQIPGAILTGRNSGTLPVQYRAPELTKNSSSAQPPSVLHATDAWSLGCLIFHVFNANFSSPQQLAAVGNIPSALAPDYKKLLATNPASRLNPKTLVESGFFRNDLVSTVTFLEKLAIHSPSEKDAFFVRFSEHIPDFPERFCKYKILPQLTASLDYGSGLTCFSAILRSVLRIGAQLTPAEYAAQVLPCVVKLFASNERQIRVHLLQHLGEYVSSLTVELVNETIFGHVVTGFGDANPTLRELTVKSMTHFAPKLSPIHMDQALRALAKMQTDAEPAIRTNTGYALAKIAPSLSQPTAEKVLIPAFTKMLRDPFPPARIAGLTSLMATLDQHRPVDVARQVLPSVSPLLVDDVADVRTATLKLVDAVLPRMHAFNASEKIRQEKAMAAAPNAMTNTNATAGGGGAGTTGGDAATSGAAAVLGSFGSWAVGAVRNKVSNADAHPPSSHLHAPSAASGLSVSKPNYASSATSSSAATATGATPSAASASPSTFDNDDFFDDFGADPEGDSDDDLTPVAVTLATKKPTTRKEVKKPEKKSILAPPPAAAAAAKSTDAWNFDLEETSGASTNQSLVDDFDTWGSSTPAVTSTKHAPTKSTSGGATFDLLSSSSLPQHKKSSSLASPASDPFASLSLGGSSPKPRIGVAAPLAAKTKVAPLLASKPLTATTSTAAKKSNVDDWGDFLNS